METPERVLNALEDLSTYTYKLVMDYITSLEDRLDAIKAQEDLVNSGYPDNRI